uniref:Torsin-1A-interacting protein 1/2 AAA+ activator domain-containing protein n=1 Tax=Leptobrachium leishanense TaxID=445787 RepID=A0A8C5R356_9ANUR
MDTGERPAKNIGSSVDSEKNEEIKWLPQDAEETNDERIAQSVNAAAASAGSKNKTREELFVGEKQVSSGTSAQTRDTEKHTCEALPQSGNAGEEGDVHIGSPADHVKEPDLLKNAGDNFADTGKIPCDLHPDTKEKSAISERRGEDLEKIKSAPSVDPVVPLTTTEGTPDEASVTSANPGEAPVTCEDSKQKANTKVTLPGEEEILGNTPAQSTDTNEGIEQSGNTGEKGETASPLDGAIEASVLPVEKRKTEAGSDFKEKPDLGTKSAVDTEEQKVHSADKGKVHDEKRAQSTSTGGNDLPLNENLPSEATEEEPDLKTESHLVVEDISSEATVQSASKAESYGEARASTASDGDKPVPSTDTTKGIDKRASLPVYVVKPSESFEDSRDIVQPVHDAGPSPRSTEAMDQPKDEHKDDSNVNLRKRGTPSISQHIVTESPHPASDEKYKADQMENQSYARTICSVAAGVFVLAAGLYVYLLWQSSPHAVPSSSVLHNYQYAFENLKKYFPGQNEALWLRSEKMHLKHLNKTQPLEPATIILTAARDGERTLRCLSEGLARTYSSALKASYSVIDGSTKAKQESKDAKLEIDQALSSGFSSNDRAAVLHRLEELPPGSVLILYKYCDHENAAFKNVALVFTVVLQVPTMDLDLPLRELEEKVKDVLWDRYLHTDDVNSFDEMDVDKLSGVWSRISHLVLPVVPVESIEFGSCPWQVVES